MMNFIRSLQSKRPFPGKFSLSQLIWNFICISFHENPDLYCHNRVEIRKRIKCPLDQAVLVLNIFVTNFHQEKFDWSMLLVIISRDWCLIGNVSGYLSKMFLLNKNQLTTFWNPKKDDIVFFLDSEKDSESFWKYVNRRKLVGWFCYQLKVDQIVKTSYHYEILYLCVLYNFCEI